MKRSVDALLSKGICQEIEIIETRLLTAEECLQYRDVLLHSNKDLTYFLTSSAYSHRYQCVFTDSGILRPPMHGSPNVAPIVVFKTKTPFEIGTVFTIKNCHFLVLSSDVAIYCNRKPLVLSSGIAKIFDKSGLKYMLDRWTERLLDGNPEMPESTELYDWRDQGYSQNLSFLRIKEMAQTSEPYIEIDKHKTLCRYIPALGETDVVLPEGIESIRNEAFLLCDGTKAPIHSIHLPSTVKYIEAGTFWDLCELETITVHPDNVAYMVIDGVLFGCKDVAYSSWLANKASNLEPRTLICYPPQKKDLTEYVVPPKIDTLEGAFSDCQLESITIDATGPEGNGLGTNDLSNYAFRNCKKLRVVNFINHKNIRFWGHHHFVGCNYGLRVNYNKRITILIPEGLVSKNGKEMFYVTSNNDEWHCPEGVEKLHPTVKFSGFKKIFLSDSCDFVWHSPTNMYIFAQTKSIEEIHFGKAVKKLFGDYIFAGCTNLRIITGESLNAVGGVHFGDAFYGCDKLERIIPGPNCWFSSWEKKWPENLVVEAPKGSQTIEYAKAQGLKYKEI